MEITENNINSALFLKYLITNGFNPNNYNGILELVQSASKSMSQFLSDYRQYLLSRQVDYYELDTYGIDGAFGYLEDSEILVPKTLMNDDRFIHYALKTLGIRHGYDYPSINEFDAIICNDDVYYDGVANSVFEAFKINKTKYLGFCIDSDDVILNTKINEYKKYLEFINLLGSIQHELVHDTISEKNKELYLIKSKGMR